MQKTVNLFEAMAGYNHDQRKKLKIPLIVYSIVEISSGKEVWATTKYSSAVELVNSSFKRGKKGKKGTVLLKIVPIDMTKEGAIKK
jgi:hypothetical protein